jgi:hypothetical protein
MTFLLSMVLEIVLGIVCALVGFGALYLLFRGRLTFSGQKLPWYGFRRLPNGDIDLDPEYITGAGLIMLAMGFALWVAL